VFEAGSTATICDHPGSLFRWMGTPNPFWRAPVRLSEDNEYVCRELLGYTPAEYQASSIRDSS
jgi:crotonobetainyl-CoA:carnitine CoA-transferase CaiB-like acyl-CoA transferase